ncbi:BadF/BadG/BcrA/BcrD ATPase family protein [Alteromonas lipolytica]|uniref:ATPase BadF/BadG/BcrA/BcrD type domain-containing protein n=1 Tax=Alteromonas lipolytica TaxID=1856405 RepID=A0A1E8FIA1_9ALTE|nr:BadF/BadG/BcrA/BcrD ATPase family protein [Alteromonas lipolytica]OFI35677.1 hypothetical protein BFC17_13065 [Alteromonas lipolytica]GGF78129.1 ATPase [Alteromonas lipolytica]
MIHQQYFLGIDGGGTKCKARLESLNGELLGEGLSGPANPAQSADIALNSIIDAAAQAVAAANLPAETISTLHVCLGLAGVNIPAYRDLAEAWQLPFANTLLTTDLHVACAGAHGGQEGAIMITGTGSSAFACVNDVHTMMGGHGFPLGDKASGAWLGWRALSSTLEAMDGLSDTTPLTDAVCEQLHASSAEDIVAQALHYRSADYAALAPVVVGQARQNEALATAIIQEGAAYLTMVLQRLSDLKPQRLTMIGGLASYWSAHLPDHIQRKLSPALCSPEYGAVALARQAFKEA